MLYSRYYGKDKDKALLDLQAKQRDIIKKADEAKRKATDHAERLKVEAQKRSDLKKLADEKNAKARAEEEKKAKSKAKKKADSKERSEEKPAASEGKGKAKGK